MMISWNMGDLKVISCQLLVLSKSAAEERAVRHQAADNWRLKTDD
jgi:hypothetical protein